MSQETGVLGHLVGTMIRRSVKHRFHNVYWSADSSDYQSPTVLYANHHGWMDGYLMFHLVGKLGICAIDWIEEFDAFPLFSRVGGMRFDKGDIAARAKTIRQTIRLLREDRRSLVLFPEGKLHRPPQILPFGRSIEWLAARAPELMFVPVAIFYQLSMHERPEAWLSVGTPERFSAIEHCEARLVTQLSGLQHKVSEGAPFDLLAHGTRDVNERHDMRRIARR